VAKKLTTDQILDAVQTGQNLALKLNKDVLDNLGIKLVQKYQRDKVSRKQWETRTADALKLALQVMEKKDTPWEGASNVKFPLLTIAAVQFSSRAYPALVEGTTPVNCRVFGEDPTGEEAERARLISKHMSWQVLEEDEDWEEGMDRLLIALPIVGCTFKKTYFDASKEHNVSEHVLAADVVVDYYTKSLDTCRFLTHRMTKHQNFLVEKMRTGVYRELPMEKLGSHEPQEHDDLTDSSKEAQGLTEPEITGDNHLLLEIHCWEDLDEDGYEEPYIVVVHKDSKQVLRIAPRIMDIKWAPDGRVARIEPAKIFTKYELIPSPDSGFYGLGLGALLGPLNESVNTIINQLVDAGTLHNLQGGFIGKGVRIKGGRHAFRPGEWKTVLSTGDDLRKNLVPLPTREPSAVLFSLLGLLIQYGERLSSTTDAMTGENPGQNQAATTTMAVIEQGMKVYTGIFKRIYKSMKDEFRKLFMLNQVFLKPEEYFRFVGEESGRKIRKTDYELVSDKAIAPTADPNTVSDAQRLIQAEALANRAMSVPGYNLYEVEKRYLAALRVPGIEQVYPDPTGPNAIEPKPDPKVVIETAKLELENKKFQAQTTIESLKQELAMAKADAEISKLKTAAILDIAKADNLDKKSAIEDIMAQIETLRLGLEKERDERAAKQESNSGGNSSVESGPDDSGNT